MPNATDLPQEQADTTVYGPDLIRQQGLWKTIVEDYRAHPRLPFTPGYLATVNYRYGTWTRTLKSSALRKLARVPYWLGHLHIRNVYGIELFDSTLVGRRLNIAHQSGIVIHIRAKIGDDCVIRQNVTIGASGLVVGEGPVLENGVDVGAGAVIVGEVKIGRGAHIGPNTVVRSNVPAGATVFAPAARTLSGAG